MEAPKRIWAFNPPSKHFPGSYLTIKTEETDIEYVRADLVERLLTYSGHMGSCKYWNDNKDRCTCGFDSLFKEIRQ